eukprot:TRINITY_DN4213_c0_g1_i1.p1 TRINITY_DN4213_c0_g1~~TRINITY_DN4213_c0_g1_i1.p1  ORF type:complete len:124 (-),score=23.88 TRINITY_DN4213_c0_g1_i1:492-812(-)
MVNVPKEKNTFCVGKCKKHTAHKINVYKAGARRDVALGQRRYVRKQAGYGGQTRPIFHKKAKVTKKTTLRIECTKCGAKQFKALKRAKKFECGAEKKSKKGAVLNY